jgi:hypothetical protein
VTKQIVVAKLVVAAKPYEKVQNNAYIIVTSSVPFGLSQTAHLQFSHDYKTLLKFLFAADRVRNWVAA